MADKKKKQYTNEGMDKSYRRLYSFVKPLFMLLFPFRKIHAENIPEGKVLICPNHFSDLDPLMVCFSVPKRSPIRVMAKQELMKVLSQRGENQRDVTAAEPVDKQLTLGPVSDGDDKIQSAHSGHSSSRRGGGSALRAR